MLVLNSFKARQAFLERLKQASLCVYRLLPRACHHSDSPTSVVAILANLTRKKRKHAVVHLLMSGWDWQLPKIREMTERNNNIKNIKYGKTINRTEIGQHIMMFMVLITSK